MAPALLAIVGPTGSGKSALALRIAMRWGGEIVGCDALQVYRGLDIGTAKTPESEREGVPHHLIDVVEPDAEFSAADYIAQAAPVVRAIEASGSLPIVVGGTGLYLRALRRGLFDGPSRSPALRRRLETMAERRGARALHRLLRRWDPPSAERIHPNDGVRIIRALEVRIESGRPMSALMEQRRSPISGFQVILVGLAPERRVLEERIARRVTRMIDTGLKSEVEELRATYGEDAPAFKAIGYRETLDHLRGAISETRLAELIATATVQYAKRQMTWFRREDGVEWFRGCGDETAILNRVESYLTTVLPGQPLERSHAKTGP